MLRYKKPKEAVLFGVSQLQGKRKRQEDTFAHFNDECFIIADGVGGIPHGDVASQVACETALWAYRLVRQRPYYWAEKGLFIKRIFRSTNMRVWQKRRDRGFDDGLATTMIVGIVAERNLWLGNVGDGATFFLHGGVLRRLTREDVDQDGNLTKVLGMQRLGIVPQMVKQEFVPDDSILMATDGVTHFVREEEVKNALVHAGVTTQSITDAAASLLVLAQAHGSDDNMTALIIKRVVTERARF